MKKVIVASQNPVKIAAAMSGFQMMFPDEKFEFKGVKVESGVSDQPMSDVETLKGATNRASNAAIAVPNADFWIGMEGGVERVGSEMRSFAWIVIKSKDNVGKARTGTFYLPQQVVELIDKGMELGDADDIVFGHRNSKQKNGAVGILTGDVIVRESFYTKAVVLALIPFRNAQLY